MTQLVIPLTEDLIETVFTKVTDDAQSTGLDNTDLETISRALPGALEKAWAKIHDVVKECSLKGWKNAKVQVFKVLGEITEEAEKLGLDATEFKKILLDRLRQVFAETFDLMLSFMPSEVKIRGDRYCLNSVELEHKLVLSGSIEVSLTALCKFVGSGEFVVKGAYGLSSE